MELYDKIHENEELKTYILAGNRVLGELGFTEHGLAHAGTVSKMARGRYSKFSATATTNASSRRSPDTCTISAT